MEITKTVVTSYTLALSKDELEVITKALGATSPAKLEAKGFPEHLARLSYPIYAQLRGVLDGEE